MDRREGSYLHPGRVTGSILCPLRGEKFSRSPDDCAAGSFLRCLDRDKSSRLHRSRGAETNLQPLPRDGDTGGQSLGSSGRGMENGESSHLYHGRRTDQNMYGLRRDPGAGGHPADRAYVFGMDPGEEGHRTGRGAAETDLYGLRLCGDPKDGKGKADACFDCRKHYDAGG